MEEIWNKAILDLERTMRQLDTDPTLAHVISSYLKSWQSGSGIQYSAPREFQMLILAQSGVGWRRFFEGWWVTHWASLQQRYYTIIKSTRTGNRWVSAIIQKLWNIAWDLWEHQNGILHENENQATRSMTLQLNSRVSQVYNDLSSRALRQHDRHLVYLPLSQLLKKDANYKATWLSIAEPALSHGRRDVWQNRTHTDRMLQGMRRNMFSWLQK
jgi:hypothetical protein